MNLVHRQRHLSRGSTTCREGNAAASQTAAECLHTEHIRLLVHAACAARIGAAQMTLGDWRDVEQAVKQKLNNENQKAKIIEIRSSRL
jgi:hypothetical protein